MRSSSRVFCELPNGTCNRRAALPELRLSYFVIMIIFDAFALILMAKIELLDPFLASVELQVAIPPEFGVESRIEKDDYLEGLKDLANAW